MRIDIQPSSEGFNYTVSSPWMGVIAGFEPTLPKLIRIIRLTIQEYLS